MCVVDVSFVPALPDSVRRQLTATPRAKQVFRNCSVLSHNHPSWLWRGATVFNQPSADTQLLITDAQAAPRATISDNFLGSCRSSRPRYASRRRAAPIQHDPAPATRASPGLGHAHVAGALAQRADSPHGQYQLSLPLSDFAALRTCWSSRACSPSLSSARDDGSRRCLLVLLLCPKMEISGNWRSSVV